MTNFTDVSISDEYADDAMRDRVVMAANEFAQSHPELLKGEIAAIHNDPGHAFFDELESALHWAAIEGFADQSYVPGEIHSLR